MRSLRHTIVFCLLAGMCVSAPQADTLGVTAGVGSAAALQQQLEQLLQEVPVDEERQAQTAQTLGSFLEEDRQLHAEVRAATAELHTAAVLQRPREVCGALDAKRRVLVAALQDCREKYYGRIGRLLPEVLRAELALRLGRADFESLARPARHGAIRRAFPSPCNNPAGIATDGVRLWVVDIAAKMVFEVSPISGVMIQATSVAREMEHPLGLCWDGRNFWFTDEHGVLHRTDESFRVRESFETEVGQPTDMSYDGQHFWVSDSRGPETIAEIDPATREVVSRIPAPGKSPFGIACLGDRIWVTNNIMRKIGDIYCLDPKDGTVVTSFQMPERSGAVNGMTAAEGGLLWLTSNSRDRIYLLDPEIESFFAARKDDVARCVRLFEEALRLGNANEREAAGKKATELAEQLRRMANEETTPSSSAAELTAMASTADKLAQASLDGSQEAIAAEAYRLYPPLSTDPASGRGLFSKACLSAVLSKVKALREPIVSEDWEKIETAFATFETLVRAYEKAVIADVSWELREEYAEFREPVLEGTKKMRAGLDENDIKGVKAGFNMIVPLCHEFSHHFPK